MNLEYFTLQLPRSQTIDLYRALLTQYMLECAIRKERGLEAPSYPPLLEQLEESLKYSEEVVHKEFHAAQDELWEHSWYSYTEEWAWYRAKQQVEKTLGARAKTIPEHELNTLAERVYEEKFDDYIAEIDMQDSQSGVYKKTRKNTTSLKRNPPTNRK